jgi:phosphoglycolate phosphatase-like HAD superfamily hydrolase
VTLLVLFDVDGTLFLTPDSIYNQALVETVEEVYGVRLRPESLGRSDHSGETARSALRKLLRAEGLDDTAIDRGLERWTARDAERYVELLGAADTGDWELAPALVETLDELVRDHRIALLTGNPEPVARARMERLGLTRFFPSGQGGFGSDGEHRSDLIGIARRRAGGWPAERTVLVGDTPRDVAGAHAAGVRAVGITLGRCDRDDLAGADAVIDSMAALPDALRSFDG